MSTGLNCSFIEVKPGEWWYILEQGSAPKNAWDWREYADAYGPFTSEDLAKTHLRNNHANPGGWDVREYVEGFAPDKVLQSLLDAAKARRSRGYGF